MTAKQLIKTVLFLVALGIVALLLCDLFEYKNSNMTARYYTYKELPKGSVDAVYLGSSGVDRFWIPSEAYDKYGMTVYPLSTEGAQSWSVLPMLKEAFRYQTPKLVIIDIRPFIKMNSTTTYNSADVCSRRVIDMLNFFSPNRYLMISNTVKALNTIYPEKESDYMSYLFSFVRYHDMWSDPDFTFDNMGENEYEYLGFYMAKSYSVHKAEVSEPGYSSEMRAVDDVHMYFLRELLEYVRKEKINVLFVSSPKSIKVQQAATCNTIFDILEEYGIAYIDFNSRENVEKYPFDRKEDFYNSDHVNYYGAKKYTEYLGEYLYERYNLKDHRGDEDCIAWEGVSQIIEDRIRDYEEAEKKN